MKPGAWNSNITIYANSAANGVFTNMPLAATFLFSSYRHVSMIDLTGMTYVRLKVNKQSTAGFAGAKLILRYSPVFSTVVTDYVDIGITEVSVGVDVLNTFTDSGWIQLDISATNDVYLAVIGTGGNGTLDP